MVDGIYGGVELKSIQNLKGEVQHRQHATLLVGFEAHTDHPVLSASHGGLVMGPKHRIVQYGDLLLGDRGFVLSACLKRP